MAASRPLDLLLMGLLTITMPQRCLLQFQADPPDQPAISADTLAQLRLPAGWPQPEALSFAHEYGDSSAPVPVRQDRACGGGKLMTKDAPAYGHCVRLAPICCALSGFH